MEISGLLKKSRLGKLLPPLKGYALLYVSTKETFAWPRFFQVSEISIIFSRQKELKRGRVYL